MSRGRLKAALGGLAVVASVVGGGAIVGGTYGAFGSQTQNPGDRVTAAPDWSPPAAARGVVQKGEGGETGFIRSAGSFRVFAQVTDGGNPPSGTASVEAEVPLTGYTIPLAPGIYNADGLSYNWGTPLTAVPFGTFALTYNYEHVMTDNLGHTSTQTGFSVVVDNARPTPTTVQTTTAGSPGMPSAGDTVVYTFSEPMDRLSILATWTGATATATVQINNNVGGTDRLSVNSTTLGTTNLNRADYVTANVQFANSTLARVGNTIVLTLGTPTAGTSTAAGNGTMAWTPGVAPGPVAYDRAGNLIQTGTANESGGADREF